MRVCFLFAAFGVSLTTFAEPQWEDVAINAENRLEARAYLPPPMPFVKSLAGEWEFAWEGNADGNIATNDPEKIETPFRIGRRKIGAGLPRTRKRKGLRHWPKANAPAPKASGCPRRSRAAKRSQEAAPIPQMPI